jgi:hypothetical protein
MVRPGGTGKPHPPGAADRGIAGIGGVESRVDGSGDLGKGQPPGEIVAQRLRMFGLPAGLHRWFSPARDDASRRCAGRNAAKPSSLLGSNCFAALAKAASMEWEPPAPLTSLISDIPK